MQLNDKIRLAIQSAVKAESQPPELANKLIAWMESLVDGNELITNPSDYKRRCELCLNTTVANLNDKD